VKPFRESRPGARCRWRTAQAAAGRPAAAFTLIEIMVVIAILGIVATMGIPTIYQLRKKENLAQTVRDIFEVCAVARREAIMRGVTTELHIRPQERRLNVAVSPPPPRTDPGDLAPSSEPPQEPVAKPRSGMSAEIPDGLFIEMVDVNFVEYRDADFARVRFHPNGTCDEMTIVLSSKKNEFRKISLEITTSLATVERIGSL
jgi:prepilin-type N-terminal cleavage/methylation domain-containing protein